MGCYSKR